MKTLFEYLDYQDYLSDHYNEKKSVARYFSYRYLGNKLDLDPGFLVKVMQKKLHLSEKSIPRIVKYFNFNERESEYFTELVKFGRVSSVSVAKKHFERLMILRGVDADIVAQKQYAFYKDWYHNAIRSLLTIYKFKGDYKTLAKKLTPQITESQAKKSIKLLTELGFIKKNSNGWYEVTSKRITTGEKWHSAAIHTFQQETIKLAGESLDRHPKDDRDISTLTVAIPYEDLDEIRALAADFRQSVIQMKTGNTNVDSVYQINIQVVPLTKRETGT